MTVCFSRFCRVVWSASSAIGPRGSRGCVQAWRERCSFRSCGEIAEVRSWDRAPFWWRGLIEVCFSRFCRVVWSGAFRYQEAVVPEGVFEAWREPCSIRCCGEIAGVGLRRSCSILVASADRSVFSILQSGLVGRLPVSRGGRTSGCV